MIRVIVILAAAVAAGGVAMADEPQANREALLERHGLVIGAPIKQGFSAYIGPSLPVFVTSDSLLMAWHRVFEEMIAREEVARMAVDMKIWRELWNHVPQAEDAGAGRGGDAVGAEGIARLRLLMATSWWLLFGSFPEGLSEEEMALVTQEAQRVENQEGTSPPEWLLPADWMPGRPGDPFYIPYLIFRPTGPDADDPAKQRYFRFRKWVQEMPISPTDPHSIEMIMCLADVVRNLDPATTALILNPQHMGKTNPGLLAVCAGPAARGGGFFEILLKQKTWSLLDRVDQPESIVADHLLRGERVKHLPLVVAAALGSEAAFALLDPEISAHAAEIEWVGLPSRLHPWFGLVPPRAWSGMVLPRSPGSSPFPYWPAPYYQALHALNSPPDERAPDLMRSEAWQRKQLNATLASWAEYRYATQMGTRENMHYAGAAGRLPGFVEPVSAFYRALARATEMLILRRDRIVDAAGTDPMILALELAGISRTLRAIEDERDDEGEDGFYRDCYRIFSHLEALDSIGLMNEVPEEELASPFAFAQRMKHEKFRIQLADAVDEIVGFFWNGEPAAVKKINAAAGVHEDDLELRLLHLVDCCQRLERMAERQLAGLEWDEAEVQFLENYGQLLAWLMFYESNSFLSPKDDAPRIVRYASRGAEDGTWVYHAATARPRMFFMRYPDHEGNPVLCQGAVYSFRKVVREATPTLAEWATESEAEPWPPWMEMLMAVPEEEESAASE